MKIALFIASGLLMLLSLRPAEKQSTAVELSLRYFKTQADSFAMAASSLRVSAARIKHDDSASVNRAKASLLTCRLRYKRIEFFLEHFIPVTARPFNLPPVYEVEEPFFEFQHPRGMQLIEAILFSDDLESSYETLKENADLVATYASDIHAFLHGLQITDEQVMESLRMELLRIITLGITGFDAPELKSGISESLEAMRAIEQVLQPYLAQAGSAGKKELENALDACLMMLSRNQDFDTFDRLKFLTEAALPLQKQLNLLTLELFPSFNEETAFNIQASSVFDKNALTSFAVPGNPGRVELGEKLFFEPQLSGNGKRSCATCHDPRQYFADGQKQSIAFDEAGFVKRNAPTLLYASLQRGLFWDARAKSLTEQAHTVLKSPDEMNGDEKTMIRKLKKENAYRKLFLNAFPAAKRDSLITFSRITEAIAAFEQTLAPFSSPFDAYINGNKNALSQQQVEGFNIFSGKAQCGTCHFAPVFNGLLPPLYELTELEVLGTTANADLNTPQYDNDSGRYHFFPIEYNNRAFKTPTLRNIAMTAPYMHNGAFKTLEQVMDFYNKGGGEGLGLNIQHQTLSSKPLDLTQQEIQSVIAFMQALTDTLP